MIQPRPCSVLCLDVGYKRIGIAGCDPLGISLTHLPAIFRKSFDEDLQEFHRICTNRKVKGLIIGTPLDMRLINQPLLYPVLHQLKKYCSTNI